MQVYLSQCFRLYIDTFKNSGKPWMFDDVRLLVGTGSGAPRGFQFVFLPLSLRPVTARLCLPLSPSLFIAPYSSPLLSQGKEEMDGPLSP